MATYTVDLTPEVRNMASEGGLDTSVSGGLSSQRTKEAVLVVNGSDRKQLYRLADGESYDDTTFESVVSTVQAGHPTFSFGVAVSRDPITMGHPTASSESGSTL
jgi:hypothetical protein